MKQTLVGSKKLRKQVRNFTRALFGNTSLRNLLVEKINRHETNNSPITVLAKGDYSDARFYEHFTGHSTHYSSRNFI